MNKCRNDRFKSAVKMATGCTTSTYQPAVGPLSVNTEFIDYMKKHGLQPVFESMVAGLMIDCPANCADYLDGMISRLQQYMARTDSVPGSLSYPEILGIASSRPPHHQLQRLQDYRAPLPCDLIPSDDLEREFRLELDEIDYFLQHGSERLGLQCDAVGLDDDPAAAFDLGKHESQALDPDDLTTSHDRLVDASDPSFASLRDESQNEDDDQHERDETGSDNEANKHGPTSLTTLMAERRKCREEANKLSK